MKIVADPKLLPAYTYEHPRLSAATHNQLLILTGSPSATALRIFEQRMSAQLATSMDRICQAAYLEAAKQVGMRPLPSDTRALTLQVNKFNSLSVAQIAKTSSAALGIQAAKLDRKKVAVKIRADTIADWQLRVPYFIGVDRGWQLNKRAKKQWLTHPSHDLSDNCDDNAEQEAISVYSYFDSGVLYPPDHFGCLCTMALIL